MTANPATVHVRRIYDDVDVAGARVLVDRLWPRGVRKDAADLDRWAGDVAPSDGLRRWFHADRERYPAFVERYRAELAEPPASEELDALAELVRDRGVVLLTAAREPDRSHVPVLVDELNAALGGRWT